MLYYVQLAAHTYYTGQEGIVRMGLTNRVTFNNDSALSKVVGVVVTYKVDSTELVSGIFIVWLWPDEGIVCEMSTRPNDKHSVYA